MKKLFCLFIVLMLTTCSAAAEMDLSSLSPGELQQLIEQAQTQLLLAEEKMVHSAIELLASHWRTEVYAGEPALPHADGYLEILNTQITYIRKDFATQGEYASATDAMFANVYCVIDFVLLSDYFGSAPYYWDIGSRNSVTVYLDGTMEVAAQSLFTRYRSRSFSVDFSPFVESIQNCGAAYNTVFHLLNQP